MLGYNSHNDADKDLMELLLFQDTLGQSDDLLSIYHMREEDDLWPQSVPESLGIPTGTSEIFGFHDHTKVDSDTSIHKGNHSRVNKTDLSFKQTESTQGSLGLMQVLPKRKPKANVKISGLVEREIFLHSKLKVRAPRRKSFDLGDLRSTQTDICLELFGVAASPATIKVDYETESPWCFDFCMDKESLNQLYNQIADSGHISPEQLQDLQPTEQKILEKLIWLRLTAAKAIPASHAQDLLEDLESLNRLLSKSVCSKKRTEEQLKKQFKTVLKIMHDQFKEQHHDTSKKAPSESKSKEAFLVFYFGEEKAKFAKLFKCVQMSREFYQQIFSHSLFKSEFTRCGLSFMAQFLAERTAKTANLINAISHELLSNTAAGTSLRTPWTVAEAVAADQQMKKLLEA